MKKELIKLFGMLIVVISMTGGAFAQNNVSTLKFDGSNDYVRYNDNSTLGIMDGATNYTIEAWIRPFSATVAEYDRVLQRFYSFAIVMYDGNDDGNVEDWYFEIWDNSGTAHFYNTQGDATLTLDSWNHIAVINDASTNKLDLYVNGVKVTQTGGYSAQTLRSSQNSDNLYIGARKASTPNNSFGGKIDEVRLKNVAESIGSLHTDKNDSPYTTDANTAALFHFDENTGTTTANAAGGSATISGASWGKIDDLWFPIELKSFTAKEDNGSIRLNWITASETNNKGFEIQRSKDGKDWEIIGFVDGQGDSRGEINYEFTDKSPEKINYYRLNQIDFDGNNKYSNVILVELKKDNNISVFPNPTNDFLNVTALNSNTDYYIYDKLGKVVSTGRTSGKIDVSSLASGVYYIKTDKEDKAIKFVVE